MKDNITGLAMLTVAVRASYPSAHEAILYGIALGARLGSTDPARGKEIFETSASILGDGDVEDATAAIDAAIAVLNR